MNAQVHPTAIVEDGVKIGAGTSVWDNAHIRTGARIGERCIVGDKTYIAQDVVVGDLVKLNTAVYLCTGVTLERGVMVSAHVVFTNDRYPRATTPDLSELLPSEADESTLATTVRTGATIGAAAVIGPGIEIGRFSMVGMGSVVTKSVPDFHLVVGSPASSVGLLCRCGTPIRRGSAPQTDGAATCATCDRRYLVEGDLVLEQTDETPHG